MTLTNNHYLVSFDITSLYTNVPKIETIEILTNLIYDNNLNIRGMTRNEFKLMLEYAINNTFFFFNNDYYEQIDGLAMGSPLSATLAKIFLCFHERDWIGNCPLDFKPLYYKRYVDDTFVIFDSKQKANKFLDYINSRHEKIKFTMETESNNKSPFLDLLIKRTDNKIDIEIYRKPTYTGLGVNFMSKCFTVFKNNTFNTRFHRAYHLSSSYLNFHKEILFLKNFFTQNGYLETIFYSRLRKFLNKTYSNTPIKFGPPKLMLFAKLPYFNDKTNEHIKSEMNIVKRL